MRKIPDHIVATIKDMRHQGWNQQTIADSLGVSVRSVKRYCKDTPIAKKGYKSLQLKHTGTGIPYYSGTTIHGNYVELATDGGIWFTEAGIWKPGKDVTNCLRACQAKGLA